jgi:hypothetical protein
MNFEFEICLVFDEVFGIEIAEMEKERNKGISICLFWNGLTGFFSGESSICKTKQF